MKKWLKDASLTSGSCFFFIIALLPKLGPNSLGKFLGFPDKILNKGTFHGEKMM